MSIATLTDAIRCFSSRDMSTYNALRAYYVCDSHFNVGFQCQAHKRHPPQDERRARNI